MDLFLKYDQENQENWKIDQENDEENKKNDQENCCLCG